MLNHRKLREQDDRLQLRFMDELFAIEKGLGEVQSLLLFASAREELEEDIVFEELPKPEEPEKPEKKGEDEEEGGEEVPEDSKERKCEQ